MTGPPAAQPATAELLALAAKTRPDDVDLRDLQDVIAEALGGGLPWSAVMLHTVRMLAQTQGDIRGLRIALLDPLKQNPSSRRTGF